MSSRPAVLLAYPDFAFATKEPRSYKFDLPAAAIETAATVLDIR